MLHCFRYSCAMYVYLCVCLRKYACVSMLRSFSIWQLTNFTNNHAYSISIYLWMYKENLDIYVQRKNAFERKMFWNGVSVSAYDRPLLNGNHVSFIIVCVYCCSNWRWRNYDEIVRFGPKLFSKFNICLCCSKRLNSMFWQLIT